MRRYNVTKKRLMEPRESFLLETFILHFFSPLLEEMLIKTFVTLLLFEIRVVSGGVEE